MSLMPLAAVVSSAIRRPVMVVFPLGGAGIFGNAVCTPVAGIHPRLINTTLPSVSTNGVRTWKPTSPSSLVRRRTTTSLEVSKVPVAVTVRYFSVRVTACPGS